MHIQDFNYNGTIIQRRADGFINLTQMCQANGKRLTHWLNLKSTQDYIEYIATEDGIEVGQVIEVIQGGSIQGTWGHPKLAEHLAEWLSLSRLRNSGKHFEIRHQEQLCDDINGEKEVLTKTGRIDILTESQVIEVKEVKKWKTAIGQVLVYQLDFPDREARIHLFGKCSDDAKLMILSYASRLNVVVTFSEAP